MVLYADSPKAVMYFSGSRNSRAIPEVHFPELPRLGIGHSRPGEDLICQSRATGLQHTPKLSERIVHSREGQHLLAPDEVHRLVLQRQCLRYANLKPHVIAEPGFRRRGRRDNDVVLHGIDAVYVESKVLREL
jgi:hypothetical protein